MIFTEKPPHFNDTIKVSAVYCFYEKEILLLKRSMNKKVSPGKWGVPAGKLNLGEDKIRCVIRETKEETNIILDETKLKFLDIVYIKWNSFEFVYNIFRYDFEELPEIKLNEENSEYEWVDLSSIKEYELIEDEEECLKMILNKDELKIFK